MDSNVTAETFKPIVNEVFITLDKRRVKTVIFLSHCSFHRIKLLVTIFAGIGHGGWLYFVDF